MMNTALFNKIDQILVEHSAFQIAKKRIVQHFEATKSCEEPIGLAVVGESRTGKSRVLDHVVMQYPIERREEGLYVPILSITTPSKPTVKGLAEIMLNAVGDPLWNRRASENEKTEQLMTLLKRTNTSMIMIDEFQHFYDKSSHKIQHQVTDWLKTLVDMTHVALVVAGLPSCLSVISQNEQLSGRFSGAVMMPRFKWEEADSCNEFRSTLEAFQGALSDFEFPDFSSDNIAFRFYCASGGLVGYIAKILRQAIWNAVFEERSVISLNDLAEAYEFAIWKGAKTSYPNPFHVQFDPSPTPAMLSLARTVGQPSEEALPTSRGRRNNPPKDSSASDALKG